jgi:hypothetical protein
MEEMIYGQQWNISKNVLADNFRESGKGIFVNFV